MGVLLRNAKKLDGRRFSEREVERFLRYYELVLKWNSRLHLTTIIEPEHFFQRHIFESDLAASVILPSVNQLWDMGTGMGVPGLPVAIMKGDLMVHLVESRLAKVIFLEEVISTLNLNNAAVTNSRIEVLKPLPASSCLIARAVEQMESLIPEMIRIGGECLQIILFGSERFEAIVRAQSPERFQQKTFQIPQTENRIISLERST